MFDPTLQSEFLIALGSNQHVGDNGPEAVLREALAHLSDHDLVLRRVSRFFATPAFPPGSGPEFVNAAAVISAAMSASEVLARLHEIEAGSGRERRVRWAPRTLDLDLLAAGDQVLPDGATQAHWRALALADQMQTTPDQLILPHPRMQDRAFVLVPLADVASDWRHPLLNKTVLQMRDACPADDIATIRPL